MGNIILSIKTYKSAIIFYYQSYLNQKTYREL